MSSLSQFSLGVRKLFTGFGFLFRHPKLLPWVLLPWLLGFVFFVISWSWLVGSFGGVYETLLGWFGLDVLTKGEGFWGQAAFGALWLIKQLLKPFLFLAGVIVVSLTTYLFYLIAAEPFLDLLAEKVTEMATQKPAAPFQWRRFFKGLGQSLLAAAQKVALFLAVPVVLWVLNFLPVFGNFLYVVLTFLFEMWVLGFTTIEYPMSQSLWNFRRRLAFGWRFKSALAGLGLPFLIPFAPLLFQAPMVVGGTLLYHEIYTNPAADT